MTSGRTARTVAAIVALVLLASACGDDDTQSQDTPPPATRSASEAAPTEEADAASSVERHEVTIPTPDGEELAGTIFGTGDVGIIAAHMRGRDQSTWFDFAQSADGDQYRVLTFDFRGYGGSSGARDTALDVDLAAAVDFLRNDGITWTVVAGASMGGSAAIDVAAELDVLAVISLSAPAEFGDIDALAAAQDVFEPLLLVVAEDDQPYADQAGQLDEASPASQLSILPGHQHGTNLFTEHEETLTDEIFAFIESRLPSS